jgi:sterol desaturase/sphingolipid hydroxylase (fatty acid hydroxylase superfamily)
MNAIWESLMQMPQALWAQVVSVLRFPIDPNQRIFFLYLGSAGLFAAFVYVRRRQNTGTTGRASFGGFVRFLFPREVWQSPSAWLDVRYFFFHQIFRILIYRGFLVSVIALAFATGSLVMTGELKVPAKTAGTPHAGLAIGFAVVALVLTDFVAFAIHFWQHKSPVLWEFHKVHHSAAVMHPLTNYREHPVDNLLYALATGAVLGLLMSVAVQFLGYVPDPPVIFSVSAGAFIFNIMAYNLRHSHVWLRWRPEILNQLFGSPAHHQVHHSSHPEHIDKNFAFIFPIWDVLFRSYCMPITNDNVRFGLDSGDGNDYRSCLGMYIVPFKKAAALTGSRGQSRADQESTLDTPAAAPRT